MPSLFEKDPNDKPEPHAYSKDRIEAEIAHLKKPQGTRKAAENKYAKAWTLLFLLAFGVVGLFFLDPFRFAYNKGDAIRVYLYMHNYDSDAKAKALATCGYLSETDVALLNEMHGNYQDYYPSPQIAENKADALIAYMKGVSDLRAGKYDDLSTLEKLRYNLFVQFGLIPPAEWSFLTPTVKPTDN